MIKILFISAYLNRAGTESFMMNVFRHIDTTLFHVDFLIFSDAITDFSKEIERANSQVWRLPSRRKGIISYLRALNHFFHTHGGSYHVIHWCGNSLSSVAPVYFAWKHKIPIRIIHAHSSSAAGMHNRLLHIIFRRWATKISTHHLACSSSAAKWFFGNQRAMLVNNGIDIDRYRYNQQIRKKIRQEFNIADNTYIIGHIGRFNTIKNHSFILDIFKSFLALYPNSLLMLVGNGELKRSIHAKSQLLGISSHVLFLGERSDVQNLLQAMDCFVMPSLFEGLPFVLVEAQAAGLPCVISDTVNKDIAITPNTLFLSLKENSTTWAKQISDFCLNFRRTDTAEYLENAGYSLYSTIEQLQNIYLTWIKH